MAGRFQTTATNRSKLEPPHFDAFIHHVDPRRGPSCHTRLAALVFFARRRIGQRRRRRGRRAAEALGLSVVVGRRGGSGRVPSPPLSSLLQKPSNRGAGRGQMRACSPHFPFLSAAPALWGADRPQFSRPPADPRTPAREGGRNPRSILNGSGRRPGADAQGGGEKWDWADGLSQISPHRNLTGRFPCAARLDGPTHPIDSPCRPPLRNSRRTFAAPRTAS